MAGLLYYIVVKIIIDNDVLQVYFHIYLFKGRNAPFTEKKNYLERRLILFGLACTCIKNETRQKKV